VRFNTQRAAQIRFIDSEQDQIFAAAKNTIGSSCDLRSKREMNEIAFAGLGRPILSALLSRAQLILDRNVINHFVSVGGNRLILDYGMIQYSQRSSLCCPIIMRKAISSLTRRLLRRSGTARPLNR